MKTILLFSILLCAIAMPAMSALTDADLDKIRLIVKEEVRKEVMPLKADIDTLKTEGAIRQTEIKNLKETMNNGFDNVQKDFDNVQKSFDNIQKSFDIQNNIIIACIGIPLALIAIGATVWGILAYRRNTKDRILEKQVEVLTQEIETLKQQRIVNP